MNEELNKIHEDLLAEAAEMGVKDGDLNIPHPDSPAVSPYERGLRAKYQSLIEKIGVNREKELSANSIDKIKSLRQKRNNISETEIQANIDKVNAREIELLDGTQQTYLNDSKDVINNPKLLTAAVNLKTTEREFKKECAVEKRTVTNKTMHSSKWYFALLIFIGISELTFNYDAFLKTGKHNIIFTAFQALAFAIIPVMAHIVGPMIKQHAHNRKKLSHTLLPIGGSLIIVILLGVIAYFRENTFNVTFMVYFLISVLMYLVGVYLAYAHVDSSDSFYRAWMANEKNRDDFAKHDQIRAHSKKELEEQYKKDVDAIKTDYDQKRVQARDIIDLKNKAINDAIGAYNDTIAIYTRYEEKCNSDFHVAVQEYRQYNATTKITPPPAIYAEDVADLKLNHITFEIQE